ncbi:MAG TPA: sugar ABC transporter substrate-binding protein [Limnochordia bacterium]
MRRLSRICLCIIIVMLAGGSVALGATAPAAQTTIRVWGGWGTFRDTLVKITELFEAAHPDIHVEMQEVTGDMEGLIVQIVGGAAPDVYMVRAEQMPQFIYNGLVADLTALFERDLNMADYLPAFGSMSVGGHYYGVPGEGGGYREDAMYVNRDIFRNAGIEIPGPEIEDALSFDEWTALARRLTIDRDADGEPEQWGTHFRTTRWYFFLPSNGVSVFTEGHTDTQIDRPGAIEVLRYLQDLHHTYRVSAPNSYWFETQGNVAMNILWRPRVAVADQTIAGKFDWSVAPIPAGKAGSVGLTKMNPMAINPHTEHLEEAWTFLKFLLSEPAQRINALEGRATVLRSVALDPEFVFSDKPPYNLMPFLGGNAVDVTLQFEPPGVRRPEAVSQALAALWRGEIPPETAAERMAAAWRAALSQR